LTLLKQFTVTLSDGLGAGTLSINPQLVQVWFEPDAVAGTAAGGVSSPATIFTIHGTTRFAGNTIVWVRGDDDQNVTRIITPGGRVLIRIHCGFLFATDNRNFSAALDCVTNQASTHVPGGVFESWFFVKLG
jgi:hypothetical protein